MATTAPRTRTRTAPVQVPTAPVSARQRKTQVKPPAATSAPAEPYGPATGASTTATLREVVAPPQQPLTPQVAVSAEVDEPTVDVLIPRGFLLTLDDGTKVKYEAGWDEMPQSHFDHPYTKAHGVTSR